MHCVVKNGGKRNVHCIKAKASGCAHTVLKQTAVTVVHKGAQGHSRAVIPDVACQEVYLQLVCVLHSGDRLWLRPPLNRAKMTPIILAATVPTKVWALSWRWLEPSAKEIVLDLEEKKKKKNEAAKCSLIQKILLHVLLFRNNRKKLFFFFLEWFKWCQKHV